MKKNLGFFICCMMMCVSLFLTSCNGDDVFSDNDISNESNTSPAEQKPEWVYVPERIEIKDKGADYDGMQLIGDTVCYISMNGEAEGETQSLCRYSLTDRELKELPIDWKDDGHIREVGCYTFDESCNVWLIANVYSGDFGQFRRFLYKFDSDGKNVFFKEITEQLGSGISMSGMAADEQGRLYVFSDEYSEKAGIWLYTADGSYYGAVSYDSSENVLVRGAVSGKDGKFYVCIGKGEEPEHCTLAEVDFEKKQLAESVKDFPAVNGLCVSPTGPEEAAAGQYDFLLYDDIAAYGYDFSTQKKEELFVWGDSDVNGYFVKNLSLLGDGRYFCTVDDWENDDRSVVLFTKTSSEEAPQRLNLVLAAVDGGSKLTALAVGYNRNNNQYHITVKNYSSLTDLYNAILAKETIDIIDLSGVNVEKLSKQGVLEDLGPYLEQSEAFARSDFLDGILEAYTFEGSLVGIPETFMVRTVVGDQTRLGKDAGLTLEGLLAIAGSNPKAMPFEGITREEMMQYLCMFNEEVFIDYEAGECHFDSEQFKAVLEFVKRFPDSIGSGKEEVSLPGKIQNGDVLFAIADMKSLKSFQLYEAMFGKTAACVGFPTMDGKGGTLLFTDNTFGIAAGSENKSGAWEFIESVLAQESTDGMEKKDIYDLYAANDRFPTLKKMLNVMIEYRMERDREVVDKGRHFTTLYEDDGWMFEYHAVTEDEIKVILDLLPDATPYFSVEDDVVINIINEEAGAYYSGQKSVGDVAGVIQNRVQLYLNENN